MKRRHFAGWVGSLPLAAMPLAWAQPKSIQIIVPFGPGARVIFLPECLLTSSRAKLGKL